MISLFAQVCASAERIVSAIHASALYAGIRMETDGRDRVDIDCALSGYREKPRGPRHREAAVKRRKRDREMAQSCTASKAGIGPGDEVGAPWPG